jgi:hypothetical protein
MTLRAFLFAESSENAFIAQLTLTTFSPTRRIGADLLTYVTHPTLG